MELRKILYVEDNKMDIDLTLEVFRENKISNPIIVTRDGVEALQYLKMEGEYSNRKPGNPGMILLDLKMPRMDGLEFMKIIKSDERYRYLPIIMLTSSNEETDLVASYKLGVNAYVVKPVDFSNFTDVVKQIGVFWAIINELPAEFNTYDR